MSQKNMNEEVEKTDKSQKSLQREQLSFIPDRPSTRRTM